MAEEQAAQAQPESVGGEGKSLRTAIIGTSIIMWILAIFVINALNGIKTELGNIKQMVSDTSASVTNLYPARYQITDKDGAVVYKFETIPTAVGEGSEMPMIPSGEAGSGGN